MKVIICIKAVRSLLIYKDQNKDDSMTINPYDLYALKDLLTLKEKQEVEVTCLCMGSKICKDVLIKCLAMGADNAILLSDSAFSGSDTVATTYVLANVISGIGEYNMVVCGMQSIDGETGQVVYGLADRLEIRCISNVRSIVELSDCNVILDAVDGDFINTIKADFPVVLSYGEFTTVRENISLLKIRQAQKKGISIWSAKQIRLDKGKCGMLGSKTKVLEVMIEAANKSDKKVIEGESSEKALTLRNIILNKTGDVL